MSTVTSDNLTELLIEWRRGDKSAIDRLTPLVYDEIRRMAHRLMVSERQGHSLQTTALIDEAYVRMLGQSVGQKIDWTDRAHFFAVVAQVLRRILIDHARSRLYVKRGGEVQHVSFNENLTNATLITDSRATELLALDDGLRELAKLDERKSRVVELRYFGGLTLEETADALEISLMTVRRDWRAAKAWLFDFVSSWRA
jgi:RNA polymerase sigma factor (TIGR02999 family)